MDAVLREMGLLVCQGKDAPHDTLGMCQRCHRRIGERLRTILKQAQDEQEARGAPVIRDLVEEAQSAIGIKKARRALLTERALRLNAKHGRKARKSVGTCYSLHGDSGD